MKKFFTIFSIFLLPFLVKSQGELGQRPFFNLKWTPTSLVNPTTPTFLAGMEIWPTKKVNIQIEYGLRTLFKNRANKAGRVYEKHKLGIRYHYYPKLNKRARWLRPRRRGLLPDTRRNFIGLDVVHFPQSYVDLNGSVTASNGTTLFYSSALVHRNAISSTLVFGCQVPLKKRFFIELYMGFGLKWMNVEHELAGTTTTRPPSRSSSLDLSFFDNTDGLVTVPILDAGVKIGFEMFHK